MIRADSVSGAAGEPEPRALLLRLATRAGIPRDIPDRFRLELFAELFLQGGTRSYSSHSHVIAGLGGDYLPGTAGALPFAGLRSYQLPQDKLRSFKLDSLDEPACPLWVHPDSAAKSGLPYREALFSARCARHDFFPLASSRGLLFRDSTGWRRAKIHLQEVRISRYYRTLGGRTIEHSVRVSNELEQRYRQIAEHLNREDLPGGAVAAGFYLDQCGIVLRNPDGSEGRKGEWGSIERSLLPLGTDPDLLPLPLFSFYGVDASGKDLLPQPLAVELCRRSGLSADNFLFEKFVAPIIRTWAAVFCTTGIIWEPHGQNVVVLCHPQTLVPQGIAFRDADTAISATMRTRLNLPLDLFFARNVHGAEPSLEMPEGEHSELSRVIDTSMGTNCFDYLTDLFERHLGVDRTVIQRKSRELFRRVLPDAQMWFPQTVYSYAQAPLASDRNCYPLRAVAGASARWRP